MIFARLSAGLLLVVVAQGSDFVTGQAARVVLGQSSFSSHEAGVNGTAMSFANGKLFVADASGRLLTFDTTKVPGARDEARGGVACSVCGLRPVASIPQRVNAGTAAVSTFGKTEAVIDVRNRQILLWRDVTVPAAAFQADVVLRAGEAGLSEPISVALDGKRLYVGDGALHRVFVWNSLPTRDNQPADAILGTYSAEAALGADTVLRPEALAADGTNLYVADSMARRVLVFSPGDSHLRADAVVNSATLLPGAFAGGTLIRISGTGLSESVIAANEDGSAPLPKKLGGVQVIFNGVALPLISVSAGEVRAQLLYAAPEVTSGTLYVRTEHSDNSVSVTNAVSVTLASASPGLFAFAGDEPRPGIAFRSDGPITAEQPATSGDVIKLWTTGLHVIGDSAIVAGTPFTADELAVSPVTALVNGQPAEVVNVRMPPTSIGIYEVLLRLPKDAYPDSLAHIALLEDGVNSNTIAVSVTP